MALTPHPGPNRLPLSKKLNKIMQYYFFLKIEKYIKNYNTIHSISREIVRETFWNSRKKVYFMILSVFRTLLF